jgi:hypothetical protein
LHIPNEPFAAQLLALQPGKFIAQSEILFGRVGMLGEWAVWLVPSALRTYLRPATPAASVCCIIQFSL